MCSLPVCGRGVFISECLNYMAPCLVQWKFWLICQFVPRLEDSVNDHTGGYCELGHLTPLRKYIACSPTMYIRTGVCRLTLNWSCTSLQGTLPDVCRSVLSMSPSVLRNNYRFLTIPTLPAVTVHFLPSQSTRRTTPLILVSSVIGYLITPQSIGAALGIHYSKRTTTAVTSVPNVPFWVVRNQSININMWWSAWDQVTCTMCVDLQFHYCNHAIVCSMQCAARTRG